MSDARGNAMICAELHEKLAQGGALTAAESAHVKSCDTCLEAWLEATVTRALDAKPEVRVPADFAARVGARLPEKRSPVPLKGDRTRHWGLATAILLVAVGLVAAAFADPSGLNTRMGLVFMALVVSEIAGIALWLGAGRSGEGRR